MLFSTWVSKLNQKLFSVENQLTVHTFFYFYYFIVTFVEVLLLLIFYGKKSWVVSNNSFSI